MATGSYQLPSSTDVSPHEIGVRGHAGAACGAGVFSQTTGLPAGTRNYIADRVTDLRKGFTGLNGMVQTTLQGLLHARWQNVEVVDRQAAAHAVRAIFGETESADRTVGVG